MKIILLVHIRS